MWAGCPQLVLACPTATLARALVPALVVTLAAALRLLLRLLRLLGAATLHAVATLDTPLLLLLHSIAIAFHLNLY